MNDWDKIIQDFAHRCGSGAPDFTNPRHLALLRESLIKFGWDENTTNEFIGVLREKTLVKNIETGNKYLVKNVNKEKHKVIKKNATEDDLDGGDGETKEKPKAQLNGYTGPKDKTLKMTDTTNSKVYTEEIKPTDAEFNNPLKIKEPPPEYKMPDILNTGKFPKKYLKLIERMMNSKRQGTKPEISTFISDGGAGAISAQAGEVLTLMSTSMTDDEWNELQISLMDHEADIIKNNLELKSPGKRIINKSWIIAAGKSRKAIRNRVEKQYGEGAEIINTGWDTEQDVSAMGWDNYSEQKGFSTDIYVKIKTSDGDEIMDEVSLKKDEHINFLNSQTGRFRDWDPSTVDGDIDPRTHSKKERQHLINAIKEFGLDLPEPTSRKSSKVVWNAMLDKSPTVYNLSTGKVTLSDPPTKEELWIKTHIDQIREYTANSTRAIVKNSKLKSGMLKSIRQEFPLKAVGEGEESMAIGDLSLDKNTMKKLFGTSNFEEIKEHLIVNEETDPPSLAYKSEIDDRMFNIATIKIRQDGVGYGGSSIKFEMQMNKEFAKQLRIAHELVYGLEK